MNRRRTAALVVAAVGVLGACTSQPSARTVARDAVESLDGLSAAERECMFEVVDAMSKDEVEQLGEANVGQAITSADSGTAELRAFIAGLDACRAEG